MAVITTNLRCELQEPVKVQYLNGNLFSQDNQGNVINVAVFDNGEPAEITGTVSGSVIRSDGGTVALSGGTIEGNVASITLPSAAYYVPGVVSIVIKLTTDGVITTLAAVVANVYRTSTDTAIDPGTIIPSIQTLISAIETAVASIPADYSTLWATVAPTFSDSKPGGYTATEYVTYNGALYQFITNHTGAWNADDVIPGNVGNSLFNLQSGLSVTTEMEIVSKGRGHWEETQEGYLSWVSSTTGSNYAIQKMVVPPNSFVVIDIIGITSYPSVFYCYDYGEDAYTHVVSTETVPDHSNKYRFTKFTGENINVLAFNKYSTGTTTKCRVRVIQQKIDKTLSKANIAADAKEAGAAREQTASIFGAKDSSYPVDSGTWEIGKISSSGLDASDASNIHSGFISIGKYDFLDFEIDTKGTGRPIDIMVYGYKDGTYYNPQYVGVAWIREGTIRVFDKQYQYVVRMRKTDYTDFNVNALIQCMNYVNVTGGFYNNLCYMKNLEEALNGGNTVVNQNEPFMLTTVDSGGYGQSLSNAVTMPFSIDGYDYVLFDASNIGSYRYAIYSYSNGSYALESGGWATSNIELSDKTKQYILRIGLSGTTELTQAEFSGACAAVSIKKYVKNGGITNSETYGYRRSYIDITHSLTFERKAISSGGITDSTVSLLARLPNDGNIECRLNAPSGKFAVWKKSGSTYTCLSTDWTYYQYRYTGDYSSEYYVAVATPSDETIALSSYNIVAVLMYMDVGESFNKATNLNGKKIAVFGDSIVQGRFCKNSSSVNCTAPKPYSNLLSEIAGKEPFTFGIGGALVYDNNWKSLSEHYSSVTGFDVVFICAGTNDFGGNIALADFKTAYTTVLTALVSTNTEVIVLTPTRRSTNSTNTQGLKLIDYADAEKEIATTLNVRVIDLYDFTNNSTFKGQLSDGLHPNETGHRILADIINKNY